MPIANRTNQHNAVEVGGFLTTAASRALSTASLLVLTGVLFAAEQDTSITPVTVKPLSELQVLPKYSSSATVVSLNNSQLSAEISARITDIKVNTGDQVKKNDTLIRFDCREINYGLQDARERRDLAQKEATRAKSLRQSSNIAERTFNQAQTEINRARISYKQQQLLASRCTLKAPFNGVITQKQGSMGELASPGSPLLQLVDSDNLEVSAKLLSEQINTLESSARIEFMADGKSYPLEIRSIVPVVDPVSHNREIRLKFKETPALTGTVGRLQWRIDSPHIPASVLLKRGEDVGVFALEDAAARFIKLSATDLSKDVTTELPSTTRIIVDGRYGLKDGDPVRLIGE